MYGSAHVVAARGSRLEAGATAVVPLLRCRCRHGVRQLLRSSSLERAATTEVFREVVCARYILGRLRADPSRDISPGTLRAKQRFLLGWGQGAVSSLTSVVLRALPRAPCPCMLCFTMVTHGNALLITLARRPFVVARVTGHPNFNGTPNSVAAILSLA